MTRVFITGVMGSGKSTIASKLALELKGSYKPEIVHEDILSVVNSADIDKVSGLALMLEFIMLKDIIDRTNEPSRNGLSVFDSSKYNILAYTDYLFGFDTPQYELFKNALEFYPDNDTLTKTVTIVLTVSYETMLSRIAKRNREFEIESTIDYREYYDTFYGGIEAQDDFDGNTIVIDAEKDVDNIIEDIIDSLNYMGFI